MRLALSTKLTVLAKESRNSNGKDYYSITVLQDSQAGTINCTEDVYNSVLPMKDYEISLTYNSEYKSLRADSVFNHSGDAKAVPAGSKLSVDK